MYTNRIKGPQGTQLERNEFSHLMEINAPGLYVKPQVLSGGHQPTSPRVIKLPKIRKPPQSVGEVQSR